MRGLFFKQGNNKCKNCQKDEHDIVDHILNSCDYFLGHWTARLNLIIDRLSEAMALTFTIIGIVYDHYIA
jgi:hypothetical protein